MNPTFFRVLMYIVIITAIGVVFTGFDSGGPLPDSTTRGQIVFYVTFYGLIYGFWMAIFEGCYRAARYMNRPKLENAPTKELDVPETRPLPKP